MTKLNLKQYFDISNFLKNKTDKDFKEFKTEFLKEDYNDDKKLYYLKKYYKPEDKKTDNIFETILLIEGGVLLFSFLIGFVFTFLFYDKEINIKLYAITSICFPLLYFVYLLFRNYTYKFPTKAEQSVLNLLLKKKFRNFDEGHSHVIKIHSILLWMKIAISYTIGVFVATMIIFSVYSVTFYSGTTYGANDYNVSYQSTSDTNKSNSSVQIAVAEQNKHHSSAYWSKIITYVLAIMIVLKLIIYLFARKNNILTMEQALINQGKDLFDVLKTNTEIGLSEECNKVELINEYEKHNISEKQEKIDSKDYYILYYQISPDIQSKIKYNISNEDNLKDKTFSSYSYGLFDKDEDDIQTLEKLNNLVVVYTSAETIPDEAFKRNMQDILKSVTDIWIVPLKDDNNELNLLEKEDKDYNKWEKVIKNINNNHIRIHFDA